jgi:hypothetical protein
MHDDVSEPRHMLMKYVTMMKSYWLSTLQIPRHVLMNKPHHDDYWHVTITVVSIGFSKYHVFVLKQLRSLHDVWRP